MVILWVRKKKACLLDLLIRMSAESLFHDTPRVPRYNWCKSKKKPQTTTIKNPPKQPKLLRVLSLNYPQSKLTLRETVCMKARKIRYETKMNKKQT